MKKLAILICLIALACNSPFTPKPRGYFRIDMPERKYRLFDEPAIPYSVE